MTTKDVNEKIRQFYIETKVKLVKLNGLSDILRSIERFLGDDDRQRINCDLDRKGSIAAWDSLIDVLKGSGVEAFEKFFDAILSQNFPAPVEVRESLRKACIDNGLEKLCGLDSWDNESGE